MSFEGMRGEGEEEEIAEEGLGGGMATRMTGGAEAEDAVTG